jgi:hypothetical protein
MVIIIEALLVEFQCSTAHTMKKVKNQEFLFRLTKSQNSILLIFLIETELPNKPESLNILNYPLK